MFSLERAERPKSGLNGLKGKTIEMRRRRRENNRNEEVEEEEEEEEEEGKQ